MSEKLRNKIGENEELRQKEGSDCSTYNENAGNLEKDEERKGVGECAENNFTDIPNNIKKLAERLGRFKTADIITENLIIVLKRYRDDGANSIEDI